MSDRGRPPDLTPMGQHFKAMALELEQAREALREIDMLASWGPYRSDNRRHMRDIAVIAAEALASGAVDGGQQHE